jgi:putative tributyrin esterase
VRNRLREDADAGNAVIGKLPLLFAMACLIVTSSARLAQQDVTPGQTTTSIKSGLQDREFQSASLGRSTKYRILLPAGYFESKTSFPVLYLLHGWQGDYQNWSTLTKLTRYAEELPLIVVMPDAGNSWYVDSATLAQDKFEQYIVHDLVEEIDKHWRTVRSADGRAIAGLSMGGYGAIKAALKHPRMYMLAASLSGAFNAASPELADTRADLRPSLGEAFGAGHSQTREQNDLYALANAVDAKAMPYFYIDCGNRDATFLEPNRKLAAILSAQGFAYEYHEYPGEHSWQYWDERLPAVLDLVRREIASKKFDSK